MRRSNFYLDYGTAIVVDDSYPSEEDSDEYVEEVIERSRREYYKAWFEYVEEYE